MWKLILLLYICAVASLTRGQQSTAVSQCTVNQAPLPINTYIEGCSTPPCVLPKLQDAVINIIFQAPHTIRSMRTLAHAYLIGSIGLQYPLGAEEVTCNFLTNTYCPLLPGEVVQYTLRMYIEPSFPTGSAVSVEFRVVDETNTNLFCVRMAIRIADPVTTGRSGNNTLLIDTNNNDN